MCNQKLNGQYEKAENSKKQATSTFYNNLQMELIDIITRFVIIIQIITQIIIRIKRYSISF